MAVVTSVYARRGFRKRCLSPLVVAAVICITSSTEVYTPGEVSLYSWVPLFGSGAADFGSDDGEDGRTYTNDHVEGGAAPPRSNPVKDPLQGVSQILNTLSEPGTTELGGQRLRGFIAKGSSSVDDADNRSLPSPPPPPPPSSSSTWGEGDLPWPPPPPPPPPPSPLSSSSKVFEFPPPPLLSGDALPTSAIQPPSPTVHQDGLHLPSQHSLKQYTLPTSPSPTAPDSLPLPSSKPSSLYPWVGVDGGSQPPHTVPPLPFTFPEEAGALAPPPDDAPSTPEYFGQLFLSSLALLLDGTETELSDSQSGVTDSDSSVDDFGTSPTSWVWVPRENLPFTLSPSTPSLPVSSDTSAQLPPLPTHPSDAPLPSSGGAASFPSPPASLGELPFPSPPPTLQHDDELPPPLAFPNFDDDVTLPPLSPPSSIWTHNDSHSLASSPTSWPSPPSSFDETVPPPILTSPATWRDSHQLLALSSSSRDVPLLSSSSTPSEDTDDLPPLLPATSPDDLRLSPWLAVQPFPNPFRPLSPVPPFSGREGEVETDKNAARSKHEGSSS